MKVCCAVMQAPDGHSHTRLGHVLLQHPGRPFSNAYGLRFKHRGAASSHICSSTSFTFRPGQRNTNLPKEIALAFQLSIDAARRRFSEIRLEERGKTIGSSRGARFNRSESVPFGEFGCTSLLSDFCNDCGKWAKASLSVEPWRNNLFSTSLLIATAAQLPYGRL